MKTFIGALFLVLLWAGFSIGGEPVTTAVPTDPTTVSESLDEANDILEGNALSGKKAKPYWDSGWNTWRIAINNGKITGTFSQYQLPGEFPVTGTKKGKTINMIATGLCSQQCYESLEIAVKGRKGQYNGTFETITCPDYPGPCGTTGDWHLQKGECPYQ